jgi:hypothetical protein
MSYLRRFGRFWYDFVVGDDWTVALGVVLALTVTSVATHHGRNLFWFTPVILLLTLALSLRNTARRGGPRA